MRYSSNITPRLGKQDFPPCLTHVRSPGTLLFPARQKPGFFVTPSKLLGHLPIGNFTITSEPGRITSTGGDNVMPLPSGGLTSSSRESSPPANDSPFRGAHHCSRREISSLDPIERSLGRHRDQHPDRIPRATMTGRRPLSQNKLDRVTPSTLSAQTAPSRQDLPIS